MPHFKIEGVKYYTVPEAASLLCTTAQTIRKYLREGKLMAVRVGRNLIVSGNSISSFLEGKTKIK